MRTGNTFFSTIVYREYLVNHFSARVRACTFRTEDYHISFQPNVEGYGSTLLVQSYSYINLALERVATTVLKLGWNKYKCKNMFVSREKATTEQGLSMTCKNRQGKINTGRTGKRWRMCCSYQDHGKDDSLAVGLCSGAGGGFNEFLPQCYFSSCNSNKNILCSQEMPKPRKQHSIHHPQCHTWVIPIRLLGHRYLGVYEYETKESLYPGKKITCPFFSLAQFSCSPMVLGPFPHPHPEDNKCLEWNQECYYRGYYWTEKKLKIIHRYHSF